MAGGIFTSQNKVRPGVYMKFLSTRKNSQLAGNSGIVTFVQPLGWGKEEELIEITVNNLTDNSLEALIGASINDEKSKLVRAALENAHTVLLYRGDIGGDKAEVTLDTDLDVVAKYAGVIGNKISVEIKTTPDSRFEVITYLGSVQKHSQIVLTADQLVDNDFVTFETKDTTVVKATVPTLLTGGTDGTFDSAAYDNYLTILNETKFNVLAVSTFSQTSVFTGQDILAFVKNLRENKGIKIQAVMNGYVEGNYEGIISTNGQGVRYSDGTELSGDEFVVWVAGASAGADMFESNTYKIVDGAVTILNDVIEANIESLLKSGYLIISKNRSGNIVIEKDINTLVTMREDTNELFKNNKTIRLLDGIANYVAVDFENNYIGKVNNDVTGQNLFKSSIVAYLTSLQSAGGITNFNSSEDVFVTSGEQPDSFYATIAIQPTYAVEKLYMVVNVQ